MSRLTSVSASTAGKHNDLVVCRSSGVKVDAAVGQDTDNQRLASSAVVVSTLGDDVKLLALVLLVAGNHLDGDEVLAEVTGRGVDRQASAISGFNVDALDGAHSSRVKGVGFGSGSGVQSATGARDRHGSRGVCGDGGLRDGGSSGLRAAYTSVVGNASTGNGRSSSRSRLLTDGNGNNLGDSDDLGSRALSILVTSGSSAGGSTGSTASCSSSSGGSS